MNTIVALATPHGQSGIGIVRVSGNGVKEISQKILRKELRPLRAEYLPFWGKREDIIDRGIALFFARPRSFTGEDVLELQAHGGEIVLQRLIRRILETSDTRIARPGEFSERAFHNEKIDLIQAESILHLINANSTQSARMAMNSLRGKFSSIVNKLIRDIDKIRVSVEASLDFPEEQIRFSQRKTRFALDKISETCRKICTQSQENLSLQSGFKTTIVGKPNVGKSTLFNALVGHNDAIVTEIPGTTRDVLRKNVRLHNASCCLSDTAGLHETHDKIEQIGMGKAKKEAQRSNCVLYVVDGYEDARNPEDAVRLAKECRVVEGIPVVVVRNKSDKLPELPRIEQIQGYSVVTLSAKRKEGIAILREHIRALLNSDRCGEDQYTVAQRHVVIMRKTTECVENATKQLCCHELLAEELQSARNHLCEMVGNRHSPQILKKIFSDFCVGK